jgi:argininosuccinate lyase
MKFAPEYVSCVLNDNFEDAKALFLDPLLAIHRAHLVMLVQQRIVSPGDGKAIGRALEALDPEAIRTVIYDGTYEDLFFYVEQQLVASCGADTAGRLHTARSRNDIDMTMYRMRQREFLLEFASALLDLRSALLAQADRHRETVFAAHTHTQPAQPSTIAHYLLGMIEQLERDAVRVRAAYDTTNWCPLGACAITGTGFPIDRGLTSRLLGFAGPTGNTYGSIATADYLLENAAQIGIALTGVGRFVQDMLLWCTAEVGYLRLADGFVQASSIMPQKRNPVALEHARSIGSRAVGGATAILTAVHNTPFGDIVDTEDDLQPVVSTMFRDAIRTVRLVAAALERSEFDRERLASRAGMAGITLTELADTLVREHNLSFREAHAIAARLAPAVTAGEGNVASLLGDACKEVAGVQVSYSADVLAAMLSPRHFVDVRTTHGGPAPGVTARAVDASRTRLDEDRAWHGRCCAALNAAARELQDRAGAL